MSPTGQPGFSTLLSFLNRTSISSSEAVALTKIKHREPVLRIRMFLGLLDPDPDPSEVVRIRILLLSGKNRRKNLEVVYLTT